MALPDWFQKFGEPHQLPVPMGQPGVPGFMGLNPFSGTPMGPSQFRPGTGHIGPAAGSFGNGQIPAPASGVTPSDHPEPAKPPLPPTRPSPALAAFRASVAPQGGLGGNVPMPPERPIGLGQPQAPAANPWDRYNETGNAADFVRANAAMGGSPQGPMAGPGSWLPSVSRFGDLIDKDSVAGKLMQMTNTRQRTGPQAPPEGILGKLMAAFGPGQGAMTPQAPMPEVAALTPQYDANTNGDPRFTWS